MGPLGPMVSICVAPANGQMDGWKDGLMDGQMDGGQMLGYANFLILKLFQENIFLLRLKNSILLCSHAGSHLGCWKLAKDARVA